MILGAGLGTRMRPLSEHWAKPMLPVLDEPLALLMIRALAAQGVDSVIVNAHAHAQGLIAALTDAPVPVEVSAESELLGTGGGIRRARSFLDGPEPFIVLNADMRIELDLAALLDAHVRGRGLATLGLRDDPRKLRFGSIGYDAAGEVRRLPSLDLGSETGSGLFIGAHVMEPRIFDCMPDRDVFEVLQDVYAPALRRGEHIHAWLQPASCSWWPVGEPLELLEANLNALRALVEQSPPSEQAVFSASGARIDGRIEAPVWIGAGAQVARGASVGPWTVVSAGSRVSAGTRLERALVLPGAHPPAGAELADVIVYGEEVWRRA